MVTAKREQRYPQLQMVRLGADFAWILDAIDRLPEGRSGAIRALLHEVLGKRGTRDLEIVDHSGQWDPAAVRMIPPVRMIAGYEHLPAAIDTTRGKVEHRLKRPVDRADVIRSALWSGLVARGVKAPKKPRDLYEFVRKHPKLLHSELAEKLGVTWKVVARVRRDLGVEPLPEQKTMARRLTAKEIAVALNADMTQTEAAKKLGVSQKSISVLRKKAREKK
jgi:hypothetical protein